MDENNYPLTKIYRGDIKEGTRPGKPDRDLWRMPAWEILGNHPFKELQRNFL